MRVLPLLLVDLFRHRWRWVLIFFVAATGIYVFIWFGSAWVLSRDTVVLVHRRDNGWQDELVSQVYGNLRRGGRHARLSTLPLGEDLKCPDSWERVVVFGDPSVMREIEELCSLGSVVFFSLGGALDSGQVRDIASQKDLSGREGVVVEIKVIYEPALVIDEMLRQFGYEGRVAVVVEEAEGSANEIATDLRRRGWRILRLGRGKTLSEDLHAMVGCVVYVARNDFSEIRGIVAMKGGRFRWWAKIDSARLAEVVYERVGGEDVRPVILSELVDVRKERMEPWEGPFE